jgi:Secretion system C-terminal sorting domain
MKGKFAIVLALMLFVVSSASAKKVKFAVNMVNEVINITGVHVMGDFQAIAGFPNGDWQPNTTVMLQEVGDTNIYSVVVDIPAFRKYEYRFLNGDQSYNSEFIPEESRVGYDFVDNRWLYVDSLANDTTYIGAIVFSGNAPLGLNLMRFKVNMAPVSDVLDANGTHLIADFQNWNLNTHFMYSFVQDIHEIIAYDTLGVYAYQFVNGESESGMEGIPDLCGVNARRELVLLGDSVLDAVCFGGCNSTDCVVGVDEMRTSAITCYPNPMTDRTTINLFQLGVVNVYITSMNGALVKQYMNYSNPMLSLSKSDLSEGMYLIQVVNRNGKPLATEKLMVQ